MTMQSDTETAPIVWDTVQDRITAACRQAADYLLVRQSAIGGFCFYRSSYVDEPNLHDTYHAVAALALLDVPVPRQEMLDLYLRTTRLTGLDYLYFYGRTQQLLHHSPLIGAAQLSSIEDLPLTTPLPDSTVSTSDWLASTLKIIDLKRRFATLAPAPEVVNHIRQFKHNGGYGDRPNLSDTCRALRMLSLLQSPMDTLDTRDFVNRMQLPAYGFTLTDNSRLCNLDVLYSGIQCCEMLKLPIRYASDILAFVLACQTAGGGFSAVPGAAPNIGLTHRALQILALLGAPLHDQTH